MTSNCRVTSEQFLGVDKFSAGLPKALGGFLLAKPEDIDALLADTGGEAGKIAVRRNETKSVEPAAMQQVHCIDDQRDVGCILSGRVGKLLLRYDGVSGQLFRPALRARIGELAVNATAACLPYLAVLLD